MNERPPIRDRFLESARAIVPSDDAWERLQQRLVESKRRRRLGRAAVVVTSLALSLGTLGFFAAAFLNRQDAPPARQPVLGDPRAEIAVTTHIAGEIQSVAVSSSGAWVATIDRSSRCTSKILRVNATGTRTRLLAEVDFDVDSLATGGGVIWASGVYCRADGGYSGVVARIDPDGLVSFTLVKHAAATDDIEYFADSVWVAVEQGQGGRAGEVLRVDPERRRLTGSLRFDGIVGSLSPGAGVLWVGEAQLQSGELPTYRIVSVDPTTLEQGAAYDVEAMGSFLPAGDVLWVQQHGDEAIRLDAATGRPETPSIMASPGGGFTPLLADESGVWYLGEDQRGRSVIAHLNSTTQASEGQVLIGGSSPVAHDVDRTGETIWIADADGSLQRVDIIGPPESDTAPTDEQAAVATFDPAPGWNTVNTPLAHGQDALQVSWAANVQFVSETDPSGFPTKTIRSLPPDGIVMTAIGPRPYTGSESPPELRQPLDLSQGFCAHDNYEGQPAENVSKCRIDTMVGDKLLNVTVWFGSNRPSDAMVAEANEELGRLVIPST